MLGKQTVGGQALSACGPPRRIWLISSRNKELAELIDAAGLLLCALRPTQADKMQGTHNIPSTMHGICDSFTELAIKVMRK